MLSLFTDRLRTYPIGQADRNWFLKWIKRYGQFVAQPEDVPFTVDRESTLGFSRQLLSRGIPAWQRLQAVRCLIAYRTLVLLNNDDSLNSIRSKLADLAAAESQLGAGSGNRASDKLPEPDIEDGRVVPGEAKIVTDFRKTIRRRRLKFATEKAYVGWLKRFCLID